MRTLFLPALSFLFVVACSSTSDTQMINSDLSEYELITIRKDNGIWGSSRYRIVHNSEFGIESTDSVLLGMNTYFPNGIIESKTYYWFDFGINNPSHKYYKKYDAKGILKYEYDSIPLRKQSSVGLVPEKNTYRVIHRFYNENGQLFTVNQKDSNGNYENGKCTWMNDTTSIYRFWNSKSELIVHKKTTFDSDFRPLREVFYTENFPADFINLPIKETEYNSHGKIVNIYWFSMEGRTPKYQKVLKYDTDGNNIEELLYSIDNERKITVLARSEIAYDINGNQILYKEYNKDGTYSRHLQTVYKYDRKGNVLHKVDVNHAGNFANYECEYQYDKYGNRLEMIASNNGQLKYRRKYKFNDQGNLIQQSNYNENNSLKENHVYGYNELGLEISSITYDAEGTITSEVITNYLYK